MTIKLSIGLKQFGSRHSAQQWIDRKIAKNPSLSAHKFSINQLGCDCHEVEMLVYGLQVGETRPLEIQLYSLFR